jgi:crotonobetainyl-CoA:carnitine CoA-transferase CaiB-like acyl-CoA transferase
MSATPLTGLKVLEFSHTVMGPTAGLVFAELGADVVKVEPAPQGDHTRGLGGFAAGFFAAFNRSKRSLAIDLKRAEGQTAMRRLAATADVVIENYAPGTMERLGCGYEDLARINPRLVYLALKGYLAGPYEHRPALDEVVQFHVGLAYMTGPPGQPLRAGASIIDILGAVFGVVAVQAALREREATGKGQRVSSALFESAAFLMSTHLAGMAATGLAPPPMPARRGAWAVYEVFPAADGELFIGVTSDQQWTRFTEQFGLQALAADPRLATNLMRCAERPWLIPAIKEVVAKLPLAEVTRRCERANVSWAPVGRPGDLFAEAHLLAAGGLLDVFISRAGGTEGRKVGLPTLPVELGAGRPILHRQPPRLGQHNREVLVEAGLSLQEVAALAEQGVIVGS